MSESTARNSTDTSDKRLSEVASLKNDIAQLNVRLPIIKATSDALLKHATEVADPAYFVDMYVQLMNTYADFSVELHGLKGRLEKRRRETEDEPNKNNGNIGDKNSEENGDQDRDDDDDDDDGRKAKKARESHYSDAVVHDSDQGEEGVLSDAEEDYEDFVNTRTKRYTSESTLASPPKRGGARKAAQASSSQNGEVSRTLRPRQAKR